MIQPTAETFLAAMQDGADLAKRVEHNADAFNDERVERLVLAALGSRAIDDRTIGQGVPMMRYVARNVAATPLVDAVIEEEPGRVGIHRGCDICGTHARPVTRLWMPVGASVVELAACVHHRAALQEAYPALVWQDPAA